MDVAVFIDGMNIYKAAREAFRLENESGVRGQINPLRMGRILAGANQRRDKAALVRVEIHRGQPTPGQDQIGHRATALQASAWRNLDRQIVQPQLRPLNRNPKTGDPEEKGIDVHLAACAVEWAIIENADVVIIFSHDRDLSSVAEVITRIKGPGSVETASWFSSNYRKRIPPIAGVTNNSLNEKIFLAIEDQTNYGKLARTTPPASAKPKP